MTTSLLLLTIILLPIGLYFWWQHDYQTSRLNQPVLPKSTWLKPFIYLWWIVIGTWKEERIRVNQVEMPRRFWLARFSFWWLFVIAIIFELMLILELVLRIGSMAF